MNYDEFLENEEEIYSEFRDTSKVMVEGLKPNIQENKGGYIIALRHPDNIINNIKNITSKIYKEVKCIKYDKGNIHTTLATYNEGVGFKLINDDLELISDIASNNRVLIKDTKINYSECLINQDSIIVAGTPNENFKEYLDAIEREANKYNIKLKMPWGAHITIIRFLENIEYDKVLNILDIVKDNKKIGLSIPTSIDIGYFSLTKDTFNINVYKSINL
ncbi:hypothetical protein [Clostridium sp. 'White wine YQ']|uniref:hypothetical protein n=1 Tax=Clostridium sp. 'White wine YQ' TaxID=3027474 RepID=UPI0023673C8C|nr:hypothetical protein [Clostridium sp. 'White wine YQ']MDD7795414.1 hypothetical protein [Clostridium sp. 'White wine YQ']